MGFVMPSLQSGRGLRHVARLGGRSARATLAIACLTLWCVGAQAATREPCADAATVALVKAGQWAQVRTLMQERIERTPEAPEPALRICMRTFLGSVLARLGELPQAEAQLQSSHADALKLLGPGHEATQEAAFHLATTYSKLGQYDKAIPVYRAMLPIAEKRHGASSLPVLTLLRNTSTALHWVGNYADALPLDTRALAIAEQLTPGPGSCDTPGTCDAIRGRAAQNLAGTLIRLERHAEALPLAQRGVDLQRASLGPLHANTLDAQLILASALIDAGRIPEARALQQQVRDQARQALGPTHELTRKAELDFAASARSAGELQTASEGQRSQLALLKQRLGPAHPEVLLASTNQAARLMSLSQNAEALSVAETAMRDTLARPDTLLFDDRSLDAWLAMQSRLHGLYIELLLRNQRVADAFLVSEALKLRRQSLSLNGQEDADSGSGEARAARKAASRRLHLIDQKVALARSLNQDTGPLLAQRAVAFAVWKRLQAQVPAASLPSVQAPPPWLAAVVQQPGAVVGYRFFGPTLVAFVTEGSGVRVVVLDTQDRVRPSIEAYRLTMRAIAMAPRGKALSALPLWRLPSGAYQHSLTEPQPEARRVGDIDEVLRSLSQWLIEPLWPKLAGRERLLVGVDQNLGHVPFESLPLTADPQAKGASGEPALLGDRLAVGLLPSLALMDTLGERQRSYAKLERRPLLAVGGAHYARVAKVGLVQFVRPDASRQLGAMDMKQIWQGVQHDRSLLPLALAQWAQGAWDDLPGSLAEVDAIARTADGTGPRRSLVLRGAQASEAMVQQLADSGELASYRLLHFTTHGFLSDDEPALSAIVLKQVNREPGTDGYLTAAEIATLDLHSDLVVVSACDSGANASPGGGGATGLSMALFQAGTVSSILSLWPIEDEDSRRFMEHFHADLAAGADTVEALRRTRVWARAQKLSRHVVQGLVRWGP